MKFRSAVITSVIFHIVLVVTALFYPEGTEQNDTTYYVDLVQIGNMSTNLSDSSMSKKNTLTEKSVSLKDLVVKKEKKPELTYPDKKSKKRSVRKKTEGQPVSVIKRKKKIVKVEKSSGLSGNKDNGYLKTGLSGTGSGTRGQIGNFPYSYYVETLKAKISSTWYNPLSSSGITGRYLSVVYFRIYRNGTIGQLKLIRKSGNRYYDLSTLRVISEVKPFPPLPSDYPEQYLGVYFEFEWEK